MMAALALLAALAVSIFWQPADAWQVIARFVAALLLIAYPFVFLWSLIRIPPRLEDEAALAASARLNETTSTFESRLAAAELRSRALERRLEPKLRFVGVQRHVGPEGGRCSYDVGIKNDGGESFDNCLVKVVGVDGMEGTGIEIMDTNSRPIRWPLVLRTQSQYDGQRSGSFNLRPGEEKPLKLVREAHGMRAIVIEHEDGEALLKGVKRCILNLTAYGPATPAQASVEVCIEMDAATGMDARMMPAA